MVKNTNPFLEFLQQDCFNNLIYNIIIGFFEGNIGAYNRVDGSYVRPYRFKKGSLKSDETYSVSYNDVLDVLFQNSRIVEGLIYKNYVFVENHICISDYKYITKDIFGKLVLTEYARRHMDECDK